jgi:hypothetical protein
MPFIPNDSDPAFLDTDYQSRVFASDFDILIAGIAGRNGVIGGGCAVSPHSPAAMSVDVSAGSVTIDAALVSVDADTVTLDPADATDPRFDLIIARDDGTVNKVTGSPDPSPVTPSPITASVALASVYIPAADTSIQANQIVDKRLPVEDPTPANSGWTTVTAPTNIGRSNTTTLAADPALQFPMSSSTMYRIRGFLAFRQTAGTTSQTVKLGIGGPPSPTHLIGNMQLGGSIPLNVFGDNMNWLVGEISGYNTTTGISSTLAGYMVLPGLNYSALNRFELIVQNGASSSPNFAIWWAQVNAVSTSTMTRLAGSYLEYRTV